MLHRLNPVRLGFLRAAIDVHWAADSAAVRPLAGKRALDVGCGAGYADAVHVGGGVVAWVNQIDPSQPSY